jgi:hypothetical protein
MQALIAEAHRLGRKVATRYNPGLGELTILNRPVFMVGHVSTLFSASLPLASPRRRLVSLYRALIGERTPHLNTTIHE